MSERSGIEDRFWSVFRRVLELDDGGGPVAREDVEEWDSLKHVELIFELEESFDINVAPDDIVGLYSDTDVILAYLRQRLGAVN